MFIRTALRTGIAGLVLGIGSLAGCDGGGGTAPETGGAGIPGVRGPVSSRMPKAVPGKGRVGQKSGPAARNETPAPAPDN
jgi:hypothetical protein